MRCLGNIPSRGGWGGGMQRSWGTGVERVDRQTLPGHARPPYNGIIWRTISRAMTGLHLKGVLWQLRPEAERLWSKGAMVLEVDL